MKINTPNPIPVDELYEKLSSHFPDYEVSYFQKTILKVKQSGSTAAMINMRSPKNIKIFGDFGTTGGRVLFTISILATGVLIPLIIYLAVFMPKQNKLRDEVANFIKNEYQLQ